MMRKAEGGAVGREGRRRSPPACSLRVLVDPDPDHLNEKHFGQPSQHDLRTRLQRGRFTYHQTHKIGEALRHAPLFSGNVDDFGQDVEQGGRTGMLKMEHATEHDYLWRLALKRVDLASTMHAISQLHCFS